MNVSSFRFVFYGSLFSELLLFRSVEFSNLNMASKFSIKEHIANQFCCDFLDLDNDEEEEKVIEQFLEDSLLFDAFRYVNCRTPIPKNWSLLSDTLPNYDEKRFRNMIRMSKLEFMKLYNRIKDHEAFQTINQLPISTQLLVTLHR